MIWAVIENNTIVNVIDASAEFVASLGVDAIPLPAGAGIGWVRDGDAWSPPAIDLRDSILTALALTDAEFQPRWIEDLAEGYEHPSFADWKARRAALRAELAGA